MGLLLQFFAESMRQAHDSGMLWNAFLLSALNFFVVSARVFDAR